MLTAATFLIRLMLTLSTSPPILLILFNSEPTHDHHSKTYDRPEAGTILSVPHRYADQSTSQNPKMVAGFQRDASDHAGAVSTPRTWLYQRPFLVRPNHDRRSILEIVRGAYPLCKTA